MKWIEAIVDVLKTSGKAMHYVEIANEIISRKLRDECKTPHISAHVIMNAHQDIFIKESKTCAKGIKTKGIDFSIPFCFVV